MGPHPPPPPALGADASLFLDLDGTIVEVAPEPEAITVDDGLRTLLLSVERHLQGRLAILSGRSLANLDAHLCLPALAASGSHGLERRRANETAKPIPHVGHLAAATADVEAFALQRGLVLERKPGGVAVHYRQHPDEERAVAREVEGIGRTYGLKLQEGSMVRELRLPGPDKGDVLEDFMAEEPFCAGVPIAVGDDLTDEHAFEAARALGGYGILVGQREGSAARYALPSVAALRHWLGEGQ